MKYIILLAFIATACSTTDKNINESAEQKNKETNEQVMPLLLEREKKVDSLTALGKTDDAVLVIKDYKRRVDSVIQQSLKRE